jgi:Poly-beta-hydroxyalkanoate depolymerase
MEYVKKEYALWISVDSDTTVHLSFTYLHLYSEKKYFLNATVGHYMVFNGTRELLYPRLW